MASKEMQRATKLADLVSETHRTVQKRDLSLS